MGAACCVAAKDRTIVSIPRGETLQRHVRTSPSWSFRWDNNRGRVAVEETTPATWLRGENEGVEFKSGTTLETAFASEEGSPLDSFRSLQWQKSPEENADQAISRNLLEVKDSTDYPSVSHPSPIKHSSSVPSVSSLSTSPLSSQSHLLPQKLTPSRLNYRSPGRHHLIIGQSSDTRIPDYKKSPTLSISEEASLSLPLSWGNESSTRGSDGGGSSDMSIPFFSDLMLNSRERTWSFGSDSSTFSGCENIPTRSSGWNSADLQTCGVCSKLLGERSSWAQKIISSTNELAVISVLTCGHVYHSECLEHMTPEINKYDPACPICTFGEKRAAKMCEKALRSEMDMKARKRSRKRVVDSDIVFDHHPKCNGVEGSGLKLGSSVDMTSVQGKPFLKRHFSFSSKPSRLLSGNQTARRKSFFWARSSSKN